ncbi:hypothetical protein FB451DRAFT_1552923 [Mycena latifolia]|nr:hypothetical protein FB451DRAFT_1552923 [Mycena latifolia]
MESGEKFSPFFPPELEREIFETTAVLYPETIYAPCLLFVAKRVYEWIERIKYRTVTSAETTQACPLRLLQNAIRSNLKPAQFFHDRVRHLFIYPIQIISEDGLHPIISLCSGIQSLVLGQWAGASILPSLKAIHLRRLSISLYELFDSIAIDLSHPAFAFVTHLESFDAVAYYIDFPLSNFALFPALTHLAIFRLRKSTAIQILASCPKLEVLVSTSTAVSTDREELPSIDARFVYASLRYPQYSDDWLAGTKGDVDFWMSSERFIAKKRRGEIQPSSRCWIELRDEI